MSFSTIVLRLLLALVIGGLIGEEREDKNMPAGFKTHILVCVGAAVVMLTSEYTFTVYKGLTNLDPARLGAQVISGIGFLGAGTIIQQGNNVKGLTTAASLWTVACIGLAAGIGFYEGAIAGAIIIYFTLMVLGKYESKIKDKSTYLKLFIQMPGNSSSFGDISDYLEQNGIRIRNIEFVSKNERHSEDGEVDDIFVILSLKLQRGLSHKYVIEQLSEINEINVVEAL